MSEHAAHQDDHGHDAGAPHATLKGYVTGFVLSVVLTAIPFWIVMAKVFDSSGQGSHAHADADVDIDIGSPEPRLVDFHMGWRRSRNYCGHDEIDPADGFRGHRLRRGRRCATGWRHRAGR